MRFFFLKAQQQLYPCLPTQAGFYQSIPSEQYSYWPSARSCLVIIAPFVLLLDRFCIQVARSGGNYRALDPMDQLVDVGWARSETAKKVMFSWTPEVGEHVRLVERLLDSRSRAIIVSSFFNSTSGPWTAILWLVYNILPGLENNRAMTFSLVTQLRTLDNGQRSNVNLPFVRNLDLLI